MGLEVLFAGYVATIGAVYGLPWVVELAIGRLAGVWIGSILFISTIVLSIFFIASSAYECATNPRAIGYEEDGAPVPVDCDYDFNLNNFLAIVILGPLSISSLISTFKVEKWALDRQETKRSL